MASTNQTLTVKIDGDATGLQAATLSAGKSLDQLKTDAEQLDSEKIEIDVDLELSRLNRDRANLERVLDGLERRKANPDVGLDITQLLREEGRVRSAIDAIDARRAEITVDVDTTQITRAKAALEGLSRLPVPGGLGAITSNLDTIGRVGPTAAVGIGAVGVAFAGWKLGEMAADMETMSVALDQITDGQGAETLDEIAQISAKTQFSLEGTATAARSLILAGVELPDLAEALDDVGTAASVAGGDIERVSIPFTQMLNKGKITAEEMQQLAEQGVPAWQILAEAMGKTVAEVQALSQAGKLGREDVLSFVDAFNQQFPTAIEDQAETFNGQMSTLKDNLATLGRDIGGALLPQMTGLVNVLSDTASAAHDANLAVSDFLDNLDDRQAAAEAGGGFDPWGAVQAGLKALVTGAGAVEAPVEDADSATGELIGTMVGLPGAASDAATGIDEIVGSTATWSAEVDRLNGELSTLVGNISVVRGEIGDLVGAQDAAKSAQQSLNTALEDGFGKDDRAAVLAYVESLARVAAAQVQGGESARNANRWYADQIGEISKGDKALKGFIGRATKPLKPQLVKIETKVTDKDAAEKELDKIAKRVRTAKIIGEASRLDKVDAQLGEVTDETRVAKITADADTVSAEADLTALTAPRHIQIIADVTELNRALRGGSSVTSPQSAPMTRGLAATQEIVTPAASSAAFPGASTGLRRGGAVTQLAPRQTPVKVYIDGAEVLSKLDMDARRAYSTTRTRRP